MNLCAKCGYPLGIGRFCTNCGHPVTEAAAAEQTAAATSARFPLYADQVDPDAPAVTAERPVVPAPPSGPHTHHHRRRTALPWVMGALILVLVAVIGAALLLGSTGHRTATAPPPQTSSQPPPPAPSQSGGEPADLTSTLDVTAPSAAPPNQDVDGHLVRYDATNMLDGLPETCWRTPGDATGEVITFTLASPAVVTEVGLVNGYAKVATDETGTYDWYRGNRRVLVVEWSFDDGTTIRQRFDQTTDLQTVPVDNVRTGAVSVRLLEVSPPGRGRTHRDYTAISDVRVTGVASG